MPEIVFRRDPSELGAAIERASTDLSDLLDLVGQRVKEASVEAFRRGGLGGVSWQPQYPGMPDDDFANLAAVLSDLNRGTYPKARRFSRKKPLTDTGNLSRSIAYRQVAGDAVEIGTSVEYAEQHQFGLPSTQKVTETARQTFARWKRTKAGKEFGYRVEDILDGDELVTRINRREFLGIPKKTERLIRKDVEDFFAGRLGGDPPAAPGEGLADG